MSAVTDMTKDLDTALWYRTVSIATLHVCYNTGRSANSRLLLA